MGMHAECSYSENGCPDCWREGWQAGHQEIHALAAAARELLHLYLADYPVDTPWPSAVHHLEAELKKVVAAAGPAPKHECKVPLDKVGDDPGTMG